VPDDPSTTTLPAPRRPPLAADGGPAPGGAERLDAAGVDPELVALPAPPRRERTFTVVLMALTAVAALAMAFALRGEASYALRPGQPADLGELAATTPGAELANRYVRGAGLLGTTGAIKYGRAAESDSFRLAPIAGNPGVWVEIRVPEGFEGPRFVPPSSFAGRLVPFDQAGIRHLGLADSVRAQTDQRVPPGAWLLIDGASPRASRWAFALALLFVGFAAWNAVGIARVLRRVE
jgi:hypothetical protein